MRKVLFAAICAAFVVAGCVGEKELKTKVYEAEAQEALTEGADDFINITINLEYPVGGASDEAIDRMTRTILGQGVNSETCDIASAVSDYIATTVANYRESNLALYEEMMANEESTYDLSWEEILNGFFSGNYKNMVSYSLNAYSFNGGAHGGTGIYCINFNIEDGSIVSEKDLFIEGYEKTLDELLTAHLYDSMSEEDYEALFVKDIESNGNFTVSEAGITYVYDEYEIGPYYLGVIEVTVPWDELQDILA